MRRSIHSANWVLAGTAAALLGLMGCSSSDDQPKGTGSGAPDGSVVGTGSTGGAANTNAGGSGTSAGGNRTNSGGAATGAGGASGPVVTLGQKYEGGQFHLGPVDYSESQWHNACAPGTKYAPAIQKAEGDLLAGLWNGIPNVASYCDACISVTTAKGKTAVLRVVTYGDTSTNSIDVSPAAYDILNSGESPRAMMWQFAECPDTGQIVYEFQTGSNEYWTSLWVRNARLPLKKVEVKSKNHASYIEMQRGTDGTLTDASGFGNGPFSLRLTSIDDKTFEDALAWPSGGIAGATITSKGNFP
jgi:expansin (peptidoglycan-binding protein)